MDVDPFDNGLVKISPANSRLVCDDDHLKPLAIHESDRLEGLGDNGQLIQVGEIPHIFVDCPVPVQKNSPLFYHPASLLAAS